MTYVKRGDRRAFEASVNDGRGIGYVWVVDGYGRRVGEGDCMVVGVHTKDEAIAAAKAEGFTLDYTGEWYRGEREARRAYYAERGH